jgi:hypothetical protein
MFTFFETTIKTFWGNRVKEAENKPQYICDSNLDGWRYTRQDYNPELAGSMSSVMDSNESYHFTNARCEFLVLPSSGTQGLPLLDPNCRQPSKPYGHRKPPNQLGWIEWIYLVLTI